MLWWSAILVLALNSPSVYQPVPSVSKNDIAAFQIQTGTRWTHTLTVTVEESKHHVTHVIRQLYLGHGAGHLLHGGCGESREMNELHQHWGLSLITDIILVGLINTGHSFPAEDISQIAQENDG